MAREIEILEPGAELGERESKLAPRLAKLDGMVIGFLDNAKLNADVILARLEELLSSRFKLAGVVKADRKEVLGRPSEKGYGGEDATILHLVEKCDAVICGVGD